MFNNTILQSIMHSTHDKNRFTLNQVFNLIDAKFFINFIVRLFLWGGLSCNVHAITGVFPSQHPPVEVLPLSIAQRINLEQAVNMVLKTDLGQQFKPDIAELAGQGKIRLTTLNDLHYGESGEGCVIRDGQYYFEGFFIILNEKLNIPELASSLVHETDHYRQIKRINRDKSLAPVKIGWLEKSAFATQLNFIETLEKQNITDRKAMFVSRGKQVFDVMTAAKEDSQHPSTLTHEAVIDKLLDLGYPLKELERTLIAKDAANCTGTPPSDITESVK